MFPKRAYHPKANFRLVMSPRYVPSPLAPAALPTLATNAVATAASAVARMGQRIDAPEAWKSLSEQCQKPVPASQFRGPTPLVDGGSSEA